MRPWRRPWLSLLWPAAGIAALILFPVVASPYLQGLGVVALLYATVAAEWDITLGYAGIFNFAHLALFGIGAYSAGILTVDFGVEPWVGLIVGCIAAVVTAMIVYLPVSRLRGIYVALITFAFAELTLRFAVSFTSLTGGQLGLTGVAPLTIGGSQLISDNPLSFYLAATLLVVTVVVLRAYVRSDLGLSLVALRDAEDYAASRGISVTRARLLGFAVSAVFTGAAGGVYTYYLQAISPGVLDFSLATLILSMVLVGGAATLYGPIAAGVILGVAAQLLAPIGPIRFVLVAFLVLLTVVLFPAGLWGGLVRGREVLMRVRGPRRFAGVTAGGRGAARVDIDGGRDEATESSDSDGVRGSGE